VNASMRRAMPDSWARNPRGASSRMGSLTEPTEGIIRADHVHAEQVAAEDMVRGSAT
jgi:hypothetical protein